MSSTSLAVIRDSSNPTAASASENGAMMLSVWSENGTEGMPRIGSELGSVPSSPTFGTCSPVATTAIVSATIAISGAGTALVTRGTTNSSTSPTTTRPAPTAPPLRR